jgi:MOSC domain-containing protein YiiM
MGAAATPHVVSIVYRPRDAGRPQDHFARVPLERVRLVEFQGIEGDAKGSATNRQLNVMCAEVVEQLRDEGFKADPGELGEQIVIAGVAADSLVPGARLRLGEAIIEVTLPRTGCARFEMIQGKPKESAKGRLGVMARVVTTGEAAVGDPVELLPAN